MRGVTCNKRPQLDSNWGSLQFMMSNPHTAPPPHHLLSLCLCENYIIRFKTGVLWLFGFEHLMFSYLQKAKENDLNSSSCEVRSAQVMRVKWVCPAGMWGLRRHSCCKHERRPRPRLQQLVPVDIWHLTGPLCLLFLKDGPQFVSHRAVSVLGVITDTTLKKSLKLWFERLKAQFEAMQELIYTVVVEYFAYTLQHWN